MKSIWLPLALLAGSFGSAAAQPHDHKTDDAIQQAKLELEEAQQHLKELLAEQADKQAMLEKKKAMLEAKQAAQQAEISWVTTTAPREAEAKVVTKAFTLGGTPMPAGDCAEPQAFAISLEGADLELGDAFAQAFAISGDSISITGHDSDVQVIDLGDGRTMMIQIEAKDLTMPEGVHAFAFAPEMGAGGAAWLTDVTEECETSDCCGSCESSCEEPAPQGGGHGAMMMGGGHGGMMMGGGHGGMMGRMMGDGHGLRIERIRKGAPGMMHGHGGADFEVRSSRTHEVMLRVDGGAPQWLQIPCEPQAGRARAPRAPQAFWGQGLRQNHPMFPGMGQAHGEHGGMWLEDMGEAHGEHGGMWFEMDEHGSEHGDMWIGGYAEIEDSCHGGKAGCDAGGACDAEATCKTELACDAGCGAACDGGCEASCDTTKACDAAASACGDCDGSDCGDCASACESGAPVACETADEFFVGGDVDAEIEALIAELEDVTYGEHAGHGSHEVVVELELDEYSEIDALIAEIEAELSGIGYVVEEPILIDVEMEDTNEYVESDYVPTAKVDEKQERIEELETEVSELRELVESLVKELNQR